MALPVCNFLSVTLRVIFFVNVKVANTYPHFSKTQKGISSPAFVFLTMEFRFHS
jgi:hypothetical protein